MKKLILIAAILPFGMATQAQSLNAFMDETDAFLKAQVVSGKVNYKGLSQNNAALKSLVRQIAKMKVNTLSANEKKAFYINAYNISVMDGIVENYPAPSPLKIEGFFDGLQHRIGGRNMTLNDLEKKELLKATGDEKLHFVLVCAAVSCPPLASFAYRPEKLEAQILERTRLALNDSEFIRVNHKKKVVALSEIFKWYAGDFAGKAASLIEYLNKFRTEAIPADYKTDYYPYDWTLND